MDIGESNFICFSFSDFTLKEGHADEIGNDVFLLN